MKCEAKIWHGSGHQSKTDCTLAYNHTVHYCVYGSYQQEALWTGNETYSGFFDEAPGDDSLEDLYDGEKEAATEEIELTEYLRIKTKYGL